MNEQGFEQPQITKERKTQKEFEQLLDFIEKEYFKILDKLDDAERIGVHLQEVERLLELDLQKMREYIDLKIPQLLEEIKSLESEEDFQIAYDNSLRDILGNSILNILNKVAWVVENFNNDDEKIKNRINNENSVTRRLIRKYSQRENESGVAVYYIDELCRDEEKLKAELSIRNGYLEKFSKYFILVEGNNGDYRRYPSGGEKLPFFKFFSELMKGRRGCYKTKGTALLEMKNLKIKKLGRNQEEEIIDKRGVQELIKKKFK